MWMPLRKPDRSSGSRCKSVEDLFEDAVERGDYEQTGSGRPISTLQAALYLTHLARGVLASSMGASL
jgi:hypothetical protein